MAVVTRILATGSIAGNLVRTAAFIAVGLLVQSVYLAVDLHFVAGLGAEALAGVSIVSLAALVTNAAYQILCIGAIARVGHALGANDPPQANRVFTTAMMLAAGCALLVLAVGYLAGPGWMKALSATAGTADAARTYLLTALPSYALMFPVAVTSSVLRAAGALRGATAVFVASTLTKATLTALLVNGHWGLPALGVAGAGLASSIAIGGSLVAMAIVLRRHGALRLVPPDWIRFHREVGHIVRIGVPASAEMGMVFLTTIVIQWALRDNGAQIQAGFGVAMRMSQILLVPGMAMALALAPQVAQCAGAGFHRRKRRSVAWALGLTVATTVLVALVALAVPERVLAPLVAGDAATLEQASVHLAILSVAFVPTGVAYVASAYGQGIGRTLPALFSATLRIPTCVAPVYALGKAGSADHLVVLWISVASVWLQAIAAWAFLSAGRRGRVPSATASTATGRTNEGPCRP